jgi:spore maturation protein CgeB
MLGERTAEHQGLFREGIEAEFYCGRAEMLAKIEDYLPRESRRQAVAAAGRARCLNEYSNQARLQDLLHRCLSLQTEDFN